ncbi:iron hydrogenase small subunit [Desulfurobacterium thermolithotrophum DSM 11699]|uniref:Iron hydrogenase small subunit n=1 Tax=Desulfurobacterium thermolithotrophum (strain DSM 11699 / BSA) TaxID=868864 RepID=F0S0Z4_DESTD|nr:iron hydrogenase small subunit [Desulfurobacterium thermolithotrophum]ADY72798.1 iron hydrogenase small subunit [Desulfurobacterium thermolithotrophum DSM 11699]
MKEERTLPYQYEEKPASTLISRRTFLKVTGAIVSVIAISGYAITDLLKKRNKYIKMRQAGLYKDDQRLQKKGLAASYENPVVQKFYKEFAGHPLSEVSEHLLHTKYVVRSNLKIGGGEHGC